MYWCVRWRSGQTINERSMLRQRTVVARACRIRRGARALAFACRTSCVTPLVCACTVRTKLPCSLAHPTRVDSTLSSWPRQSPGSNGSPARPTTQQHRAAWDCTPAAAQADDGARGERRHRGNAWRYAASRAKRPRRHVLLCGVRPQVLGALVLPRAQPGQEARGASSEGEEGRGGRRGRVQERKQRR